MRLDVVALLVDGILLRVTVLLAVLVLASAVGVIARRRAGRARDVIDGERLSLADLVGPPESVTSDATPGTPGTVSSPAPGALTSLGDRATFVQFSSPACSPCRAVYRVLDGVVDGEPGLVHLDIDASERLDLARRLGIMRTPTVLLLDPEGRVVSRISGVLTADQARAAIPEPTRSR